MEGMTIAEINQFFFDNVIPPLLVINVYINGFGPDEDWINEHLIHRIERAIRNG